MSGTPFFDPDLIAVVQAERAAYPVAPPFHPPERYAELAYLPEFVPDATNCVYPAVREALARIAGNGEPLTGNPLAILVRPGDTVVLKPNFVKEHHQDRPAEWQQVITHGAIVRAVCDYVLLALQGKGEVIICDAPQADSSFVKAAENSGTQAVVDWYQTWSPVAVRLLDLRRVQLDVADGVVVRRHALPGDPKGYVAVDLGAQSFLHGLAARNGFYGADYDTEVTAAHHSHGKHEYLLSATVMEADVVINLPKLKTHKKTGFTCALKNLVGINGDKNWLPHYQPGNPSRGGDEYPDGASTSAAERRLAGFVRARLAKAPQWMNHVARPFVKLRDQVVGDSAKATRGGNWAGNDTTWRMAMDLNLCLLNRCNVHGRHIAADGVERDWHAPGPVRYLAVVDGIVGGEGNGPMSPDAKASRVVLAGVDPVMVDQVAAQVMGLSPENHAFTVDRCRALGERLKLGSAAEPVIVGAPERACPQDLADRFQPHPAWQRPPLTPRT